VGKAARMRVEAQPAGGVGVEAGERAAASGEEAGTVGEADAGLATGPALGLALEPVTEESERGAAVGAEKEMGAGLEGEPATEQGMAFETDTEMEVRPDPEPEPEREEPWYLPTRPVPQFVDVRAQWDKALQRTENAIMASYPSAKDQPPKPRRILTQKELEDIYFGRVNADGSPILGAGAGDAAGGLAMAGSGSV